MALEITFINEVDYWASSFAEYMSRVIKDGYLKGYGNDWAIIEETPKTLNIQVDTGEAFLTGRRVKNPALSSLSFAEGDATHPRIDMIILEVDILNEEATLKILKGTAAASPVEPTLTRTSALMQYALRVVPVPQGALAVDMDDATNVMDNPSYFGLAAPVTGQYQEIVDITCPDLNFRAPNALPAGNAKYVQVGNVVYCPHSTTGYHKKLNLTTGVVSDMAVHPAATSTNNIHVGGFIYNFIAGGVNKRYKYSIALDSWANDAISATNATCEMLVLANGKVYSFKNSYNKVVEIDLVANTFTQKAAIPAGTVHDIPVTDDLGNIYFVIDSTSATAAKIYKYDITANTFTKLYEGKLQLATVGGARRSLNLKYRNGCLLMMNDCFVGAFNLSGTKISYFYIGGYYLNGGTTYASTWLHPYRTTYQFNVTYANSLWLDDGRFFYAVSTASYYSTPFYYLGISNKVQLLAFREKPHPEIGIINFTTLTANDDATVVETGDEFGLFLCFPEEVLTGKVTIYG